MYTYKYGDHWHPRGDFVTAWSEARARKAHDSRKAYSAIFNTESVSGYISFAGPGVAVSFLDERGRTYLNCGFYEEQPNRLFLVSKHSREFRDRSVEPAIYVETRYFQDGRRVVDKTDGLVGKHTLEQSRFDASQNWIDYPEFGQFDALLRLDL